MLWKIFINCNHDIKLISKSWCFNKNWNIKSFSNIFNSSKNGSQKLSCIKKWTLLKKPSALTFMVVSGLGMRFVCINTVKCEGKITGKQIVQASKTEWSVILRLLIEDLWTLLAAIAASLLSAFLNTLIPLSLGKVVNTMSDMLKMNGISDLIYKELRKNSLSLIALYILQSLSTFSYIFLLSIVGERLALKLRHKLFQSILNQDVEFFDRQRTGELVECLSNDVMEFKSSFKVCVNQGLRSTTQIVGCVFSLFYISPVMTTVMIAIIPTIIIVGTAFGSLLRSISHHAQAQVLRATNLSEEVISNIRTVKAFGNESLEIDSYFSEIEEICRLNTLLGCGIGIFQAGTNLFLNAIVLGTLYVGSHLISGNKLSPGNLMSFLVATQTIQRSFAQLSLLFGNFVKGKLSGTRILHFISLKPSIPSEGGILINHHSFIPSIEFKDVYFSYPTRPKQEVLKGLNLTVPAGKTIAIVGASGNGKSTIVALLERFYDASKGSIMIGGVELKDLDITWLRQSAIGLINQEPTLFASSIKENIRYGKPDASDDEVVEAAVLANADTFIKSFPDGYDTILGERGVSVSGGQKQRIALARVLLKNPAILILDEATSALDPESESIVQKTLEKVCHGRTVLVIAHRLSTVQNADTIFVINDGVIVEQGDHATLCKKKGFYYTLMRQQEKEAEK